MSKISGNSNPPWLIQMFVLTVTALGGNKIPAILFIILIASRTFISISPYKNPYLIQVTVGVPLIPLNSP